MPLLAILCGTESTKKKVLAFREIFGEVTRDERQEQEEPRREEAARNCHVDYQSVLRVERKGVSDAITRPLQRTHGAGHPLGFS